MHGRHTESVSRPAGADDCEPVSRDRAFAIVGGRLRDLDSPGRAVIYAGGRTSNETAFVYPPFARP